MNIMHISEKLDYTPGVLTVQRHVRGKWACSECQTLTQAPVPAQIIDKGLPTSGLLAQVLGAKYSDHLPLYRQETIFGRSGYAIARSTLAQWVGVCGVQLQPLVDAFRGAMFRSAVLHADETPVAAAVMSLIQSAKLNGHDPYAYLKDVLTRLPTQKNSRIDELLPHRWIPLTT